MMLIISLTSINQIPELLNSADFQRTNSAITMYGRHLTRAQPDVKSAKRDFNVLV